MYIWVKRGATTAISRDFDGIARAFPSCHSTGANATATPTTALSESRFSVHSHVLCCIRMTVAESTMQDTAGETFS